MASLVICPSCGKQGIVVSGRTYYSRGWPAKCRECGGLAYDRPHGPWAALGCLGEIAKELLPYAFIGAVAAFPRTVGIASLILIPAAIVYWRRRPQTAAPSTRFRCISLEQSQRSRHLAYVRYLAMLVAVIAFALWLSHSR